MAAKILGLVAVCILTAIPLWALDGGTFIYDPNGKRDPFVPIIGVIEGPAKEAADVTSVSTIKLQGIARNARGEWTAIVDGEFVKEGDQVRGVTVKKIEGDSITVSIQDKDYVIPLYPNEEGR